ncbi:hypothetical protein [Ralstonia solanacearum]|uniref:hypothetical protein n=1 Tax=Ralstonia solanacearum TaxID=305 RepID=UPI000181686A|nr:hypothetical protein [Ralstonia solanacearum]MDC6179943.1 hypothetical protein [Ralstonia solanacearum]MDC6212492.1 hypothetical protein [Ralstonia solanacearum]MDC6241360.1 hypothetical protein [Ralstonia solanacearum]MDD7803043.1 hypothetical protein [Ralstonia solanacearum]
MQFAMVRVVAMQGASRVVPSAHALGGTVGEVPPTCPRLMPPSGSMDHADRVRFASGSGVLDGAITELSAGALTRTAQSTPCDNAGRSIVI